MSILIFSGLPASGKTRRALEWVAEDPLHRCRINFDDLRMELFGCKGTTYFSHPQKLVRDRERQMKGLARVRALEFLGANPLEHSIVIDNTNLTESSRAPWVEMGRHFGIPVEQHDVDTPVHECVERDRLRQGDDRVGRAVIERMALTTGWVSWEDQEVYPHERYLICDVDGTIADTSRRRHFVDQKPKDWDGFFKDVANDEPIKPIVDLLEVLSPSYNVIIMSGRPIDKCGLATEDWLYKHLSKVTWRHLFMRSSGDKRPDTEIKMELLEYLPKHRVALVLDDRDIMCKAWRDAGLICLQCAPGAF